MKKYVSLLPPEYKKQAAQNKKISRISSAVTSVCLVFAALIAISGGIYLNRSSKLERLKGQEAQINDEIAMMSKYDIMRSEMQMTKERIAVVYSSDFNWLEFISDVSNSIPQGVWTESITCVLDASGQKTLELVCGANTYSDVSKTITSLESEETLKQVYCSSSSEVNGLVTFNITVIKV